MDGFEIASCAIFCKIPSNMSSVRENLKITEKYISCFLRTTPKKVKTPIQKFYPNVTTAQSLSFKRRYSRLFEFFFSPDIEKHIQQEKPHETEKHIFYSCAKSESCGFNGWLIVPDQIESPLQSNSSSSPEISPKFQNAQEFDIMSSFHPPVDLPSDFSSSPSQSQTLKSPITVSNSEETNRIDRTPETDKFPLLKYEESLEDSKKEISECISRIPQSSRYAKSLSIPKDNSDNRNHLSQFQLYYSSDEDSADISQQTPIKTTETKSISTTKQHLSNQSPRNPTLKYSPSISTPKVTTENCRFTNEIDFKTPDYRNLIPITKVSNSDE